MSDFENPNVKRPVTRIVDDVEELFERLQLEPGKPVMADKQLPGTTGRKVKLQTNIYGLSLQKIPVHRYDVNVIARLGEREVLFTKRSKEDAVSTDRKDKCRTAFELAVNTFGEQFFGQERYALYYDCQSILYSMKPIPALEDKMSHELSLLPHHLTDFPAFTGLDAVVVEIKKVADTFNLNLGNLGFLNRELIEQDHSLQQFLELITSQHALFTPADHICYGSGTSFLLNHKKYGFLDEDCPDLGEGKYLAVGSHKSVRFVEGPGGRSGAHAAVVVDTKKAAFHACENLIQKAMAIINLTPQTHCRKNEVDKLRGQLKGLFVHTKHGRRQRLFPIASITEDTAADKQFEDPDGNDVTLQIYFQQKYGITLRFPHAPLVVVQENKQTNYYPMEVCYVNDNQRVALNQQTPLQIQKMIRACATPPAQRVRQNKENMRALELNNSNRYLQAAEVRISNNALILEGRVLQPPDVYYGNGVKAVVHPDKGSWRLQNKPHFLLAVEIHRWAIYVVGTGNRDILDQPKFENFIRMYMAECRSRGIRINDPCEHRILPADPEIIKDRIKAACEGECYFMYFITSDAVTDIHKIMKYAERECGVITQDMRMSSANDVVAKGKRQTLENVVNKTNIKLGGINYDIRFNSPDLNVLRNDRLFLGFAMSHPAPQTQHERNKGVAPRSPSVIGFSANMKSSPVDFVGDCVFQEPRRDEKIGVIRGVVNNVVTRFRDSRGYLPKELIIYRNGSSEGQYPLILKYEVPLIKKALEEVQCDAKVTLIVSQKMHNVRLMLSQINERDRAPEQNIKPGTVLDVGAVHPVYNEFYLNSHVSLQGSAKTPRYTVLFDENNYNMDQLEYMTYHLSYGHQIVTLATSLPAPAYIASRYADRGRNLFNASNTNWNVLQDGQLDYNQITRDLSYGVSDLRDYRVNA